jgi:hypothetical protein
MSEQTLDTQLLKSLQSQITFLQQTVNSLSERVRCLENKRTFPTFPNPNPYPITFGKSLDFKKDF